MNGIEHAKEFCKQYKNGPKKKKEITQNRSLKSINGANMIPNDVHNMPILRTPQRHCHEPWLLGYTME